MKIKGENKYYKRCCIECYVLEGLVTMCLDITPEDKMRKEIDYHNVIVPKSSFHKILELYENVLQHGYKNISLMKFQM